MSSDVSNHEDDSEFEHRSEMAEWIEERREELEHIATSDYKSAWVAEKLLQSEDGGDS